MDLQLTISGKRNFTRQIYRELRQRILDGRLKPGERLPSSRELANELAVARKTITNVYDLLISEGFLDTRHGSGTFVSGGISQLRDEASSTVSAIEVPEEWDRFSRLLTPSRSGLPFDFAVGVPDISRFPYPLWRSLLGNRARMLSRNAELFPEPQGYAPLREEIAKYTGFTRAVVCSGRDVLITNGAQQAFALIAYVLVRSGSVVAMEQPGYPRARWLFEAHGARIAEVSVDEEGLIVDKLPHNAKLIYVTPSHQFPLGVRMSLARRRALLEWAAEHGAAVVEDDYDSEFRYEARPLDSLQSLDRHGVVLYVGTFSKVLFPGIRTGFIVAPEPIRRALVAARHLTDWHGPQLIQATLAKFIQEGHLARHIRKMRRIYAQRRQLLFQCLESDVFGIAEPWPSAAGLHIAVRLNRGLSGDEIANAAKAKGVGVDSLGPHGLALGYGAIEISQIEEGARRLMRVIRAAAR
ncbi:MAG: GntR family transcriptional regulator / MocR family aminotransferase [Blastocatellia bacterium]|nr:GntR family transcriptional regulator / MocR family aminotransferase [Blastocatellia bacterium]